MGKKEDKKNIDLEILFNQTKDVIWSIDAQIKLVRSNAAFNAFVKRITGKTPTPGESVLYKAYGEETNAFWLAHYKRVLAGECFSVEIVYDGNGKEYGEVTFNPIYDESKNIIGAGCFVRDITAYKMSEIALKKANDEIEKRDQRYRAVIQNSHDVITIIGESGLTEYVSPSAINILGYTPEELIGLPINHYSHPDDVHLLVENYSLALADPNFKPQFTIRFPHKQGHWIYISITGTNQLSNPLIKGVVASIRDITELVLAEQKAVQNEAYFRSLTENFPNGAMCVLGTDFKVQYAAGEDFKIFDIDPKSMLGLYYPQYYGADKQEYIEEKLGQIISGKSVNYELPFKGFHYLISGQPLYNSEGNISEIILLAQNITERNIIEEALRESEEKFRMVSEHSPIGIFQVALNGYCTWMNERMCEIFGITLKDGLGYGYLNYVNPNYIEKIKDTWTKFSALKQTTPKLLYQIITPGNDKRWAYTIAKPLKDKHGNISSYLATIEDITEIKQYQDEIIASRNQQEKVLNSMPNGAFYIDNSWTITYINEIASKILNYSKNELIGWDIWKRFPEAQNTSLQRAFFQAKEDRKQVNTIRFYNRLGIWIDMTVIPEDNGILVYIKNISERVELQSHLQLIYKLSDDAIGVARNGYFVDINPSLSKMLGYTDEELKAKPLLNFVHPEDLDRTSEVALSLRTKTSNLVSFYNRYIKKDGGIIWLSWNSISDAKSDTIYFIARNITEQKKEEEYLRMLQSVVTNTTDAVLITTADNIDLPGPQIVYVNQAFTNQTGYTPEDVLGKTPRILQGPETSRSELIKLKHALIDSKEFSTEIINYKKDGTPYWVSFTILAVKDDNGKLTHYVSVQRDVSEIKKAELKLIAYARQQENLASLGSSIVWLDDLSSIYTISIQSASLILDTEISKIVLWDKKNKIIREVFSSGLPKSSEEPMVLNENSQVGYCISEGKEIVLNDFATPGKIEITEMLIKAGAQSGIAVPLVSVNGTIGALGLYSLRVRNYSHDEINYIKTLANILSSAIERIEANKKINLSERKYRIMFEENPIPSWIFDPETLQFVDVNAAAIHHYGYSREEYLKMKITDIRPLEDIDNVITEIKNASNGAEYKKKVWRHIKKSGEIIYSEVSSSPINLNGKVYGLTLANDVTRKVQLEEEREKYQEELERIVQARTAQLLETNKELEAFNYTASHDLRTPIRAIQMFVTLFEREYTDDGNLMEYVKNIKLCTYEMNSLIDDLLEFSRLRNQTLDLKEVDMDALARVTAKSLLSIEGLSINNIKISKLHPANGDSMLLKSVWQNLISNAIKYSKKEPKIKITITSTKKDGWVTYTVEDNGVGFDMKYIDKLFKPFSRLHSSYEYSGTGAGLAIVDRIISRHGGKVFATSSPNVGSKFSFSLPNIK